MFPINAWHFVREQLNSENSSPIKPRKKNLTTKNYSEKNVFFPFPSSLVETNLRFENTPYFSPFTMLVSLHEFDFSLTLKKKKSLQYMSLQWNPKIIMRLIAASRLGRSIINNTTAADNWKNLRKKLKIFKILY